MLLSPIRSPSLRGVRHAFFDCHGGVSSGLYATLNCGRGSDDDASNVAQNRARVAEALGVEEDHLASVNQVHSARVVTIGTAAAIEAARTQQADALVTDHPGIALGVLTADCQPVLLADARAGVIGAAHAGWRGLCAGVLGATVEAMQALGARKITAVIGPCISQRHYEVGWEFFEEVTSEDPEAEMFFANGGNGRPMFDLPGLGLARLRAAGVEAEWTGHCTYADAGRFYSYRRATHNGAPDYGRQISAIAL